MAAVKRAFLGHVCVVSAFTAADEKLARDWEHRGVPMENVERVILLGVARKYTACLNHGVSSQITSLRYFAGLLGEIEHLPASPDYWAYLVHKIQTLQTKYRQRRSLFGAEPIETK